MKAAHEKEAGRQHIENGFTTYGYEYDNFFFSFRLYSVAIASCHSGMV